MDTELHEQRIVDLCAVPCGEHLADDVVFARAAQVKDVDFAAG